MKIEKVIVGSLSTNCYVIGTDKEVIIVDPGADALKIIELVGARKVLGIVITHYHFDHFEALQAIKTKYSCPVYDYSNMHEGQNNIGDIAFDVIYTPGHKDDSISLYFKNMNALVCGDFIFKHSIGRYDLEGGDYLEMQDSIKNILEYPDEMIIYPGHGETTTLKEEREYLKSCI